MSDDLEQALADTEPVTVGALRQVLAESLGPIHDHLNRLEDRMDRLEDSLRAVRSTMTDMRGSQDAMRHDIQNLYRGQADIRGDIQRLPLRQPEAAE